MFAQALWLVLQGRGLQSVIGHNPSPIHPHPSLLLLLPVYALFPFHLTLIIARNLLVAVAAVPLFLALRRFIGDAPSLLFGLAYLFHFTILNTMTWGYHEFHLVPPFFFLAFLFLERRQFWPWLLMLLVLGGVRREMSFVLLGFAALAHFRRAPWKFVVSAAALGLGWVLVSYEIILHARTTSYWWTGAFSISSATSWSEFGWQQLVYLYYLLVPFLVVLPLAGWWVLPALPILVGNLVLNYPLARVFFLHCSIPVACGLLYATGRTVSSGARRLEPRPAAVAPVCVGLFLLALSAGQSFIQVVHEKSLQVPLGGLLGVPEVASAVARDPEAFAAWIRALREASNRISDGCSASAPAHVIAHLPHQFVPLDYKFGRVDAFPDYVLVDRNVIYRNQVARERMADAVVQSRYQKVYERAGVELYQREDAVHAPRRPCGPAGHVA